MISRLTRAALLLSLSLALFPAPTGAGPLVRDSITEAPSGLALPRFVSLASAKVNMRTGPGRQYPILWQYIRAGLPVVVTAEYNVWRRVRDLDGTEGWIHGNLLSGKRTIVIEGETRDLYRKADPASPVTLRAEPGVIAAIRRCEPTWCELEVMGKRGWIDPAFVWGTFVDEHVN